MQDAIGTIETLSGLDVIEDILERIGSDLAKSAHLRGTDAYASYSAKCVLEIQLEDIERATEKRELKIGRHDSAKPSRRFEIGIEPAPVDVVRERSGLAAPSLEGPVNGDASDASGTGIRRPRWRAPRQNEA